MAYSTNPHLPKARAIALRMHIEQGLPLVVAARRCGVHRTTLWRWKRKWNRLNAQVQLTNHNRPGRSAGSVFRQAALTWAVPTLSSRPHVSPRAIASHVVARVLALRTELKRCAEVIWYHLTRIGDEHGRTVHISLSSVRRILRRHRCFDGARKKRVRRDNPRRPAVTAPGELVQTDTIHYICPFTGRRRYVYTVIDLYSRMAYARVHPRILPGLAAKTILEAQTIFGFSFAMVQADNGPEFSRYFEQRLTQQGIAVRHSRLGRPNDNAHIERFNRTIQEECLGNRIRSRVAAATLQAKIDGYIAFYNTKRIHLGLQLRIPCEMLQRF